MPIWVNFAIALPIIFSAAGNWLPQRHLNPDTSFSRGWCSRNAVKIGRSGNGTGVFSKGCAING
jgi:hypothetical protein